MELTDNLVAIDVHVHHHQSDGQARGSNLSAAQGTRPDGSATSVVEYYRQRQIGAVLFDVDATRSAGRAADNDAVAGIVASAPELLVGFCSVDPLGGQRSVNEIERAVHELGMRGVKFQSVTQEFEPNDTRVYPVYEACQELGLIVTLHTGTTAVGQGKAGGDGLKLKYARPIPYIDDVAADFPDMTIIGAHPAWPWENEMLAIARHKKNVFIDLSGWAPKYFPENVVQQANTLLQDKCLFGSDYPFISPDRWLRDFAELPIKDEVRPKILWRNAARLLGLLDD